MGGTEQLARLAGGSVGAGLALAAAFPFHGVPPHGVAGRPAPAQVEVRVLASGPFSIDPLGPALPATAFPAPGAHGGPSLKVTIQNISPAPLKLSIRLTGLSPSLDDAVTVRGSAAGAVLVNESLGKAANWTAGAGNLDPGARTTLRLRFKLKPGLTPDAYEGRLDIRQLEVQGISSGPAPSTPVTSPSGPTTPVVSTTPNASTTPSADAATTTPLAVTTPASTPAAATTPGHGGH